MAVQAQYPPSNLLLILNSNKNAQEGHNYSLQQQQGGGGRGRLLNQSDIMLFNNGGGATTNNSRKRGRETTAAAAAPVSSNIMNPFSNLQSSQLIDLTQLHNHHHQQQQQSAAVSTGLGLSFGIQQQQSCLQLQQHHQRQYLSHSLSLFSHSIASQIKQERDEIDQFLQSQGEQLQRTLAEKRQTHYRAILKTAEETITRRLREKEMEVEKATRRNAELESRASQLRAEAQAWQAKAKAQEITAASLQAQLHHAMMMTGPEKQGRDDGCGLSCAGGEAAEDAESAYVDPERLLIGSGPKCRGCGKRVASVVVLPCRHLCICTECETHFRACPVCLTVKNSTVEVYLS